MNRISPIIVLIFFIVIANVSLNAQTKVKESSKRKKPEWVLFPEKEDVISNGSGVTLEEAKYNTIKSAEEKVGKIIVSFMMHEDLYFESLELDSATIGEIFYRSGYYKDLLDGKSDDFYWEVLVNKSTKNESCNYFSKYSLQTDRLKTIVDKIAEERISERLDSLQNDLKNFNTIDKLKKVWQELMFLSPILPDNDINKVKSEKLMQEVENIFSQIEIAEVLNIPGKIFITLVLRDRALQSNVPPILKSDCATALSTDKNIDKWAIDYSYNKCSSESSYTISVAFDNGFNILSKDFVVNPKNEKVEVRMSNTDIIIRGNRITFFVSSLYRKKVVLERITIHYNDLNFTDTPMHQVLDGAGLYDITFNLPPDFDKIKIDDTASGELYFKSETTGQKGVYHFYSHRIRRN